METQSLAEASSKENGWSFKDTFRRQYLITPKGQRGPAGWRTEHCGQWSVHHCPSLPVARLKLSSGEIGGLVVGWAADPDGTVVEGTSRIAVSVRMNDALDRIERYVEALAGRYVVLVAARGQARLYPDPACSLGPVYHAARRRAGASTCLVIDRPLQDTPDLPAADVADGRGRYLFGYTADAEVKRARPNHYLDLHGFDLHRHWPRADMEFDDPEDRQKQLTEEIGAKLRMNLAALTGRFRTALPVSGGTDSRLLLACANGFLHQINHFFVYQTNWANSNDCLVARQIAERLCFPLLMISRDAPAFKSVLSDREFESLLAKRRLRIGAEPDTADPSSVRAMHLAPEVDLVLRGNVAEMTRALRWHPKVFDDPHNVDVALTKLDIDADRAGDTYGVWRDRYAAWKDTVPDNALPRIYDFVHSELWLPHTNSLIYMAETQHAMINPFNDRRLIYLTMQIPPMIRRNLRVIKRLVRAHAPEIKDVPYAIEVARERRNAA